MTETGTHLYFFAPLKQRKLILPSFSYVHFTYQNRRKRIFLETYMCIASGAESLCVKENPGFPTHYYARNFFFLQQSKDPTQKTKMYVIQNSSRE